MKILVEWAIFLPYQGQHIRGGVEKQTLLMTQALVEQGHDVSLLIPKDSTCTTFPGATVVRSEVLSSEHGAMRISKQLDTLCELHHTFDKLFINYPLTSQSTLDRKHAGWMSKSAYINHAAQGWFVTGNAGLRLNGNLRFFRECGGRAWSLDDASWNRMNVVWNNPKKHNATHKPAKDGSTSHWDLPLFDGKFNQMLFSTAPQVQAPRGHLVTIARTDADKKLEKTVRLAKQLKLPLEMFVTPPVTRHNQAVLDRVLKEIGSDTTITLNVGAPREKLLHSLATARCCLFPSETDTFSNVVVEAMSVGVPVCHIVLQEPLNFYRALSREWGDVTTNTIEERQAAQDHLRTTYTMDAYGKRLLALL